SKIPWFASLKTARAFTTNFKTSLKGLGTTSSAANYGALASIQLKIGLPYRTPIAIQSCSLIRVGNPSARESSNGANFGARTVAPINNLKCITATTVLGGYLGSTLTPLSLRCVESVIKRGLRSSWSGADICQI